jgi:hypothetical protein
MRILDGQRGSCWSQNGKEAADFHMVFQGVSQLQPRVEPVMILAPYALPSEVASPFQIDHDPLHGPLCNQHLHRNVPNADVRPEKDAMEDVSMVAQKRPVGVL